MRQTSIRRLLLCGLLGSSAVPAGAQLPGPLDEEACLAGIQASALTRVTVYVEASADPANRHVLPTADAITILVARAIRTSLAGADTLASVHELLHWRQLDGTLKVALHRDGRLSWSTPVSPGAPTSGAIPDSAFNPARVLLAEALTVVHGAVAPLTWPGEATRDSLLFHLAYLRSSVAQDGTVKPPEARFALPAFVLPVPWERPLAVRRMPKAHYPPTSHYRAAQGTVILRFTVGQDGRVQRGTIEDEWRSDQARPTGDLGRYYREFVGESTRVVAAAEFIPALVGGCAVSQRAEMPFVFQISQ